MRLFGLVLFVAGAAAVWVILGSVIRDWLNGLPVATPFSVVWITCLIGGLSAVSGAMVFVRLVIRPEEPPTSADTRAPDRNTRLWCRWLHASALGGYLIPFAHIALPVIIWLSKRHLHPFVDANGRAAFNFQISTTLLALIGLFFSVFVIGLLAMVAVAIMHLIMTLVAARRATRCELPAFPLTINVF
ncbi:MAG: DUF4870 domain-containing protein [Gammaproteobacteria bacterium]|nr:DUF4870 domain-containing protein [Gammaproteobacteria bacterium]